jgi:hypothetical protein
MNLPSKNKVKIVFLNVICYVFTVEKKQKVSFMTTMDRELFPVKMPANRFGNEIVPLRGAPHRGPGCYENEDVGDLFHMFCKSNVQTVQ